MRLVSAFLCGGLFGAGLLVSGMTDTTKVIGWLDIFGDWDPTLAFVLFSAIVPMTVAWRIAARRSAAVYGGALTPPSLRDADRALVLGSLAFGFGWGLAGLCPGPSLAVLTFGGWNGLLFLVAMMAGMVAAPFVRVRIDRLAAG